MINALNRSNIENFFCTASLLIVLGVAAWQGIKSTPEAIKKASDAQLERSVTSCTVNGVVQVNTAHCRHVRDQLVETLSENEKQFASSPDYLTVVTEASNGKK